MRLQVEQLFHEVADLPAESRARYLDARRLDATTRVELEELLAFDSLTDSILESDIAQIADRTLSRFEPEGQRCGPYRLGELLGHGGMGSVYLAERVDGEITQRAAIKLLRAGMDSPEVRRRFLAERQILATLSHSNIARLLGAGHSDEGQPFLVMEYVEGKPLDDYAATLSTRQTVRLFLKVCAAVSYLHANLVVHRDLKPANILVTAEGEPKLLDFGIAKLLDLATDSAVTSLRMLTPGYASPEQMTGRPMSTASDVYSLGAVLYRLLTGESPHRFEGSTSAEEIARAISTGKIKPPSRLAPAIKSDLEFVIMKALRPDPLERYSTVDQFAEDLENYLASRPLRSRRGETLYRAQRFLRRNWLFTTAGALVIASLTTGLYVANRERVIAERRFGQLQQLSRRVIDLDGAIAPLPGSMEARQRLVSASLEYLEGLRQEAGADPDLAQEVADGYWRMGRIQGVNVEPNLGDSAKAETSLKKADMLIDTVIASRPGDRKALLRSAFIAHDRMILADTDQRRADALAHAYRAADRLESLTKRTDSFPGSVESRQAEGGSIAGLYGNIALAFVNMHRYPEGARYAQRAIDISGTLDAKAAVQPQLQGLSILANALRYEGDLDAALAKIREARQLLEKGPDPSATKRFFTRYGVLMREGLILGEADGVSRNRPDEAIPVLEEALALCEDAARKDAHDSASRGRLGSAARELGGILSDLDPRRAVEVFDLGIARLAEAGKGLGTRRDRAVLLAKSSYPLRRLGRAAEAKARIDEALAILKETGNYPAERIQLPGDVWIAVRAQANEQAGAGNLSGGLKIYENLLAGVMAANPEAFSDLRNAPKLSRMYEELGNLYGRTGNREKAAAMNALRVELWKHWQGSLPRNSFVRQQLEAARQGI